MHLLTIRPRIRLRRNAIGGEEYYNRASSYITQKKREKFPERSATRGTARFGFYDSGALSCPRDRDLTFRVAASCPRSRSRLAVERSLRLSTSRRKYDETSFATGINVQVPWRRRRWQ